MKRSVLMVALGLPLVLGGSLMACRDIWGIEPLDGGMLPPPPDAKASSSTSGSSSMTSSSSDAGMDSASSSTSSTTTNTTSSTTATKSSSASSSSGSSESSGSSSSAKSSSTGSGSSAGSCGGAGSSCAMCCAGGSPSQPWVTEFSALVFASTPGCSCGACNSVGDPFGPPSMGVMVCKPMPDGGPPNMPGPQCPNCLATALLEESACPSLLAYCSGTPDSGCSEFASCLSQCSK